MYMDSKLYNDLHACAETSSYTCMIFVNNIANLAIELQSTFIIIIVVIIIVTYDSKWLLIVN